MTPRWLSVWTAVVALSLCVTVQGQSPTPNVAYARPDSLAHADSYDYVPSVLWNPDLGAWQAWWCGWDRQLGGDGIFYAQSADRATWTTPELVLRHGAPGSWEEGFACDPSVLYRPGGTWGQSGWRYAMYYTGANRAERGMTGVALSMDGRTWQKFSGNPIIACPEAGTGTYGCGQLSVVQSDWLGYTLFGAAMVYVGSTEAHTKLMMSWDGATWWDNGNWDYCPGCAPGLDIMRDPVTGRIWSVLTVGDHQVLAKADWWGTPWSVVGTWMGGTSWGDGFFRDALGNVPTAQLPPGSLLTMMGTPTFSAIRHDFTLQELGILDWRGVR